MTSHVPNDIDVNLQLNIFATEDIGDTPSSPCFVNAMPRAIKNRLITNSV
jgi:hypothetical protein